MLLMMFQAIYVMSGVVAAISAAGRAKAGPVGYILAAVTGSMVGILAGLVMGAVIKSLPDRELTGVRGSVAWICLFFGCTLWGIISGIAGLCLVKEMLRALA